jgi:hypothetical protein
LLKKSIIIQIGRNIINRNMIGPKGFSLSDFSQSPCSRQLIDLVIPQEGQGIPEIFLKTHTEEIFL